VAGAGAGDDDEGGMQFDHDSLELAMQELEAEEDAANDPLAGARLAQEKIIFLTKVCFLFFCTFLSYSLFLFFPPSI